MSAEGEVTPDSPPWAVSVHGSEDEECSLGSGVVIDARRILTCAHVVGARNGSGPWTAVPGGVWVAFPMRETGNTDERVRVAEIVFSAVSARVADLAVLRLADPVPEGVAAAPLRSPQPKDLKDRQWSSFGFPDGGLYAEDACGQVSGAHGHGRVGLRSDPGCSLRGGFSGAGLWSPAYGAVVAVIDQARGNGDGRAITLYQADQWFPGEKISALAGFSVTAAGEMALSAWGWSLTGDIEGTRHWRPRGRGVSIDSERGYRFRGRSTVLAVIRDWLDRERPDRRVLVVTGSPGAGKSAVLGRIVTTADPDAAAQLPGSDDGVRASAGSVACAVHAKGKTALEVAGEIARAASAAIPERTEDFPPALEGVFRDPLRTRGRFSVVIDALDEAASPAQARAIVREVILPLAGTFADDDVQVVVGTRRADGEGDLLAAFGDARQLVDLDDPGFFAEEDLAAYVLATLQLVGDERAGNPYNDDGTAGPVADRIAALSEGNFLVAGLTARSHGLYDEAPADPAALSFAPTVEDALHAYLERVPVPAAASAASPGVTAAVLLTALAFAEAPGFPAGLWRAALRALGVGDVPETVLTKFARSAAASFLVESSGSDSGDAAFRLFHQALGDALLSARARIMEPVHDERALTRAFLQVGRASGWERASSYLLRSLSGHAARAGLVGDLLTDDAYLLHADLRRLLQAADAAAGLTPTGRDRVRLLRLTPQVLDVSSGDRAAMFSATEALENLGSAYCDDRWSAPYRALWAAAVPRREQATCQGHQGGVWAVCAVKVDDRDHLVTGSGYGTVRLWDPQTGQQTRVMESHRGRVTVCAVKVEGRDLLATAGRGDGKLALWDPRTGKQIRVLEGRQYEVNAVCAVEVEGRDLLAAAGRGSRIVRLWDPRTGKQVKDLMSDQFGQYEVNAVCAVEVEGRDLLAAAGSGDGTVLWDLSTGEQIGVLKGHQYGVNAMCAVKVEGRGLLATAGRGDGTVRLWDPRTGKQIRVLEGRQYEVNAVCAVEVEGRDLLAAAGSGGGTVRLWDPQTGTQARVLEGHQGRVWAMCAVKMGGRNLLATGSGDGTARLWNLSDVEQDEMRGVRQGRVNAVCTVEVEGRNLLVTGSGDGTVRLWDPQTGEQARVLEGREGRVNAVCAVKAEGRDFLAAADSGDGTVRLWDPQTGKQARVLEGRQSRVNAVCRVDVNGRSLLAAGEDGGTVRLWDPQTGTQARVLEGHQDPVNAVCTVEVEGRNLLVTGSDDRTVRLWDPYSGSCLATVPVHHDALAISAVDGSLAIGLDSGILAIRPDMGQLTGSHVA